MFSAVFCNFNYINVVAEAENFNLYSKIAIALGNLKYLLDRQHQTLYDKRRHTIALFKTKLNLRYLTKIKIQLCANKWLYARSIHISK